MHLSAAGDLGALEDGRSLAPRLLARTSAPYGDVAKLSLPSPLGIVRHVSRRRGPNRLSYGALDIRQYRAQLVQEAKADVKKHQDKHERQLRRRFAS